MEIALAAGTLKVAYQLLIVGIKVEQVPNAVRRCIELVRTCHRDLEALIKLRNESLPMLESKPAILERINSIIENAHNGLLEVARLVEKLRPEAHDGSSPLMGRLEWIFIDSREFSSQEPLISRQHSSVISELNFLRQLILLAPLIDKAASDGNTGGAEGSRRNRYAVAWDNVGLLDEMMGGRRQTIPQPTVPATGPVPAPVSPPAPAFSPSNITTAPIAPAYRVASPAPTLADPPPPYSASNPSPNPTFPMTFPPTSTSTNPLIYNVGVPTPGAPISSSMSSLYPGPVKPSPVKPSPERMNIKRTTTFDPDGVSFLFGDLKVTPKSAAVSGIAQPVQANATSTSTTIPEAPLSWQSSITSTPSSSTQPNPLQSQASPFTVNAFTHNSQGPSTYQPTPAHQVQPQQLHQHQSQYSTPFSPQPPPPLSKQEQVLMVQPLSTIPQELIHRHDGIESPPLNPLFSPVLGAAPLSTTQPPSVGTVAAHPSQQQSWGYHAQEARPSSVDGRADCYSSCGPVLNSLSSLPASRPSTSSIFNIPRQFEPIDHGPPVSQTSDWREQKPEGHNAGQFREPSPSRPQSWTPPLSSPNPPYTLSTPPSAPPGITTPTIKPTTTYLGTYTPPQSEDLYQSRNTRAHRAVSSLDLTNTIANPQAGAVAPGHSRGLFPQASVANFPSVTSSYTNPPIHRTSTPQPFTNTQTGQIPQGTPHSQLRPVTSGGFSAQVQSGGGHNPPFNPSVQTYATIREHWRPETVLGIQQTNTTQRGGVGVSTVYQSQPGYHGSVAPPHPQYPQVETAAALEPATSTPGGYDVGIAELYGSSGYVSTETGGYGGKSTAGTRHTEIHELPSVKFAPDPVELE